VLLSGIEEKEVPTSTFRHQQDFMAPLPGIEEKEVHVSTSRHQ
jgi:hypothetical protein